MIEKIRQEIFGTEHFRTLIERARSLESGQEIVIHGIAGSLMAFVAASVYEHRQSQVLLIASDRDKAEQLRDDCALLIGVANVQYYGERPTHHASAIGVLDVTSSIAQIETLKMLSSSIDLVVVASPQSLITKVPLPAHFSNNVIELKQHSEYIFTKLLDQLTGLGFERKAFVEGYGDFSVRGGILDVFPFVGENPVRIEFWGDTIESIREFDILSQRSIRELQLATIVPDICGQIADGSRQMGDASVFDYLKEDAMIILDEPEMIRREIEDMLQFGAEGVFGWEDIARQTEQFPRIFHSMIRTASESNALDFGSTHQPSFNGSIKTLVEEINRLNQNGIHVHLTCDTTEEAERLRELIDEEPQSQPQHTSNIPSERSPSDNHQPARPSSPTSARPPKRFGRVWRTGGSPIRFAVSSETLHSGFVFPAAKLALFTEHQIFGRLKRRGIAKRRKFKGFTQKELQQLKRSDYVVHADYGIGQFAGLQKISVRGAEQEVVKILYLENDVLYVNLNYIDRVQKYASHEGRTPKLNKLGAPDWERLKAKAKSRVKDIARDLIQLYARRKHEKGFAFSPDSHWQKEIEASFMYEDTPDQAEATIDAKRDMESQAPMDRLICGDVGFGKTEVAVRAAFKAVLDGKQVAILVPTTILAQQHFDTFKDRLGRYPVRIEFISRFKTKKVQANIIEALHSGTIDIIIGTHRLLSKDVQFKNLGLLVIDEEHRFGVAAKEKLRQLKATVDTLTLTATPIPRTLHFSLMGARDISLINTPPRNRLPIITEIAQFDWKLIREAILKELHRGGQVYFVHDRVQKIEDLKSLLEEHVPEARYAVAHGQMPARPARTALAGGQKSGWRGHQLENVMVNFLEKKYDVLICTKIIESGIDIPNVNTMIINRADRFGLAELYQLRGRVGRSNVQAYAYLLIPPISVLPKEALHRLQSIEEFTELGSGFSLAMRDLEIRGAGNLLGSEQSGFIIEMGYEMYERIVREAVEELKQEEFKDILEAPRTQPSVLKPQTIVDVNTDAYIPDFYIESDMERLEIYRRLSRVEHGEQVDELRSELRDRFGEYPPEVENLLHLVEVRFLASQLDLSKVFIDEEEVHLVLPDDRHPSFYGEKNGQPSKFQKLIDAVSGMAKGKFRLKQEKKSLTLVLENSMFENGEARLGSIKQFFTNLVEHL